MDVVLVVLVFDDVKVGLITGDVVVLEVVLVVVLAVLVFVEEVLGTVVFVEVVVFVVVVLDDGVVVEDVKVGFTTEEVELETVVVVEVLVTGD